MITSNDNRRFDFAAFDEFVDCDAELCTLSVTEPADACGQPLELNSLFREFHPVRESLIFRKQVECEPIGARDVVGVAAHCNPAERPAPSTKHRPDLFLTETATIKCFLDTV